MVVFPPMVSIRWVALEYLAGGAEIIIALNQRRITMETFAGVGKVLYI